MNTGTPVPAQTMRAIPDDIVSVRDYARHARARLPAATWAYLQGGAGDERILAENRAAFRRLPLLPRVLADLSGAHTRLTLLRRELEHPIILAPTACHQLFHPDGEAATARGAAVTSTCMVTSMQASATLEAVAQNAGAPLWFQLCMGRSRDDMQALCGRAWAAGYEALVVTVDAPVNGARDRERRAGFRLPDCARANFPQMDERGPGLRALAGLPGLPSAQRPGTGPLFSTTLPAAAPRWADLAWLAQATPLPVFVKGILSPDDAGMALAQGAAGIVVSNHGGRVLDGAITPFDALPGIVQAVDGRAPILLDGGIRRGTDILKALAMGATAVLVGRPYLYGLTVAGAAGVAHVVQILRGELEMAMALTGCATLAAVGPGILAGASSP